MIVGQTLMAHDHHGHDHHHDHHGGGHAHGPGHGHAHGHGHHHHVPKDFGRAFAVGAALNVVVVAAPAAVGV
jgi:cobalt-zinc-cadmium efflux system protein